MTRVLEQSMTQLLQLYRVWDKHRDGNISVSDFGAVLTSMNVPHTNHMRTCASRALSKSSKPLSTRMRS